MTRALFVGVAFAALACASALEAQTIKGTLYLMAPGPAWPNNHDAIKYSVPLISTPPGRDSPTALDHRFAAAGLAASAGFVCDNDGHIPQTHDDAGPLAGSEPGRLLGTTLRLGF